MAPFAVEDSKGFGAMEYADVGVGLFFAPPRPDPVPAESLSAAEESAEQVLKCVQPTLDSEERRRDVIDYIQHLLRTRLHCEVVSYGSVPLKTYLPEGDIDLTILKGACDEERLMHDVLVVIQEEERSVNSEYEVKEVQFIDAEVKLVKCLFQNMDVDISCNQLGGLSTLCFLEKVDRFVGRNHLFKRSIILVKTWCYYESRILGAHHGLISTYALEILVLYIFHFFHSSLTGPLSVLRRFLDYYSQFDWENYCVSLKGPVPRSSLPEMVVDMSTRPSNRPLLTEQFLEGCMEMFSAPCRDQENSRPFQIKHLNIMDPLKEYNNLGRSVNRGNFYRIRSALKYGSSKLGQILSQSREEVVDGIQAYFANTSGRNEHSYRSIKSLEIDIGDEEASSAVLSSKGGDFAKSYGFDLDNYSVCWEPESISSVTDEFESYCPMEIASDSCSSLRCGAPDDVSSSNYSLCHSENGGLEFHRVYSAYALEKFQFTSWLENRKMSHSCDRSEASYTTSSGSVTRLPDSYDCRETDSISIDDEESDEVLDALADLTGDYDNHIRSLLRGQLCHWFSMTSNLSTKENTRGTKEWHQKERGIGTYFPNARVIVHQDARTRNNKVVEPPRKGRSRNGPVHGTKGRDHLAGSNSDQPWEKSR